MTCYAFLLIGSLNDLFFASQFLSLFLSQLVISLHTCTSAICDKIKQSADGAIQSVTEFITKRGNELHEADISRSCLIY